MTRSGPVLCTALALTACTACTSRETHEGVLLGSPDLTVLDVDGDGVDEVLGLVRDRDPRSSGVVRVALVDPRRGSARWIAGGFVVPEKDPEVDLERVGETVVVAVLDTVHAYDLRTGRARWSTPLAFRGKALRVCADDDGASRARVSATDSEEKVVLDLSNGKLLPHHTRTATAPCAPRPYVGFPVGVAAGSDGDARYVFHFTAMFVDEGYRAMIGWKEYAPSKYGRARLPTDGLWLETWTNKTRSADVKLNFEATAGRPKDIVFGHAGHVIYSAVTGEDSNAHLYAMRSTTGERLWTTRLDRSATDVRSRWVLPRGDVVFVRSLEELALVDAQTGKTSRLRTVSFPVEASRWGALRARGPSAPAPPGTRR